MINVIDQKMDQLHETVRALDHKTARTGSWVLDTGVTEHGALLLGVSRKDGVNGGVGRVSGGNGRGRKHKIVSVSNATSRFCDHRIPEMITPEGSVIGFNMKIITDTMRGINGWRR